MVSRSVSGRAGKITKLKKRMNRNNEDYSV
jgi:hypothetical protein